ncbi:MAG: SAM hydrolase/SAM-dependent halogenase family protein [Planctomycetota bacterium]|jgi:S-adenosylmethionine hydrolase
MIILLTDFGPSEYVGVMKGVIYGIDPNAKIVDLCHSISAQDIIEASWVLSNNYRYFPAGAIFCCVVDPGVGTDRKALAVKTNDYYFVAPDNGLLWETLRGQHMAEMRQIPVPEDASSTFHGRDVFAKAAANIALGRFHDLGPEIDRIEKVELYQKATEGIVVRIDSFGNIITNVPGQNKDRYSVTIGDREYVMDYYSNYCAAKQNQLFVIEGSNNTLEISLRNAGANDELHVTTGTKIRIC